MGMKSILNAFGDVTIGAIEKNEVLKAQAANFVRQVIFYYVSCLAAQGWISNNNIQFFSALAGAIALAAYSNLRTRATKRENVVLKKNNSDAAPGDVFPAEAAKP